MVGNITFRSTTQVFILYVHSNLLFHSIDLKQCKEGLEIILFMIILVNFIFLDFNT